MIINKTEAEERQYLNEIKDKLLKSLDKIITKVKKYAQDIKDQKAYLWENKTGMDHVEKISIRQAVDQSVLIGETIEAKAKRIRKLLEIPYFGRFDFKKDEKSEQDPIYIGVHAYFCEETERSLIHDWRAPISSMFYDFETGPANYKSPDGIISGDIVLKRQYRIRKGEMEFMIETDVNIGDDILQKELSCAADEKMKNIVATIQRDQNVIIRNEHSHVLIIQGVAGSGKTSIALHRIAFLLYRFKDSIKSKDLLILSPNKVFADYISSVLPELGEETIPEIGIEELSEYLLGREYKCQTFFEQVATLLKKNDDAFKNRIQEKASLEFINKLEEYIEFSKNSYFTSIDLKINDYLVPSWFMAERFKAYKDMPIVNRLNKIAKDIEVHIQIYYSYNITPQERRKLKTSVNKMFKFSTLKSFYKNFYIWINKPELCKFLKAGTIEYSDIFPMIYLKLHWEGLKTFNHVKHLLIDEMQDYTPIQYAVISKLFSCKKTILGDANQSVNPLSSSTAEDIKETFLNADCVKLCKSYRSTFQITRFAQGIQPNSDLEVIERHGEEPILMYFENKDEEIKRIIALLNEFIDSDYNSLGIICKTGIQAQTTYNKIKEAGLRVNLLKPESRKFIQGISICTAHMSKGLEFDQVIIPEVTEKNYCTDIDKSMLYIAATRAMHILIVTFVKKMSSFIK